MLTVHTNIKQTVIGAEDRTKFYRGQSVLTGLMFEDRGLAKEVTLQRTLKNKTDLISREGGEMVLEEMAEAKSRAGPHMMLGRAMGILMGQGLRGRQMVR